MSETTKYVWVNHKIRKHVVQANIKLEEGGTTTGNLQKAFFDQKRHNFPNLLSEYFVLFYEPNDDGNGHDPKKWLETRKEIPPRYLDSETDALWVVLVDPAAEESESEGDGKILATKSGQAAASAFAMKGSDKKILEGVGTLPPALFKHLIPKQVKELFTNRIQVIENNSGDQSLTDEHSSLIDKLSTILMGEGTPYNIDYVPETNVQEDVLDEIAEAFDGEITTERVFEDGLSETKGETRRALRDIGLEDGIATAGSVPDGFFHTGEISKIESDVKFITTAIFECKDTRASPDLGHGEGIANATNAAVAMVKHGMPLSEIVVPVFTTTGSEVQVAAVYMLEPCFPAVCFVTKKLDMNDEEERVKAATVLVAMSLHNRAVEGYIEDSTLERNESMEMGLNTDKYHLKSMDDFFRVFEDRTNKSLTHMLKVTSRLAGSEYFCLPLGVRLKDSKDLQVDAIIFPKLTGYCIGFPEVRHDRESLLEEMEKAVHEMHEKGVVHNDLYLSNFMWKKKDDGTFSVKIIDFDAAHKLDEQLTDRTRYIIHDVMTKIQDDKAIKDRDLLYMKMFRNQIDNPKLLKRGPNDETEKDVKRRLDGVCEEYIRSAEPDVDETASRVAALDISKQR